MKACRTAQTSPTTPGAPRAGALVGLAVLAATRMALGADIEVRVVHFGAADLFRGGGPVAVQAEFRSALDRPVELEVAWEIPNADLDIAEHTRSFVLNPGQAQRRWLYAHLPPIGEGSLALEVFDLRLFERAGGERVRDLGTAKLAASIAENTPRVLGLGEDALAVVGGRSLGLDAFALPPGQGDALPSMNSTTAIGNIRDAESFPDRWEGYAIFDSVVWGSGAVVPSRLSEDSAGALLGWVERGGNLVIALPAAGDPWSIGSPGRHALSALLPSAAPARIDDVRVRDLLPLISLSGNLRSDQAKTRIAVFDPKSLDREWRPFLALPARKDAKGEPVAAANSIDGSVVGIRRPFGFGFITVLGLDVDELSASGLQVPAMPQGDVFWNRVLGRRADTPSGAELTALLDKGRLTSSGSGYTRTLGGGGEVAEAIDLPGAATVGVLTATAVFGLYWLVAGPLGFAILRAMKRQRWAWVVSALVAIGFSIGIWAVGRVVARREPTLRHVTVLDFVAPAQGASDPSRPELKRATSWLSMFVPTYGTAEVALDPDAPSARRNTLVSWRAADRDAQGFPSRERYIAPLDEPNRIDAPARATAIDLEARWLGGVDPKWGGFPQPTSPVEVAVSRDGSNPTISVTGALEHRLPGTLRDVTVIHVWPQRNPLPSLGLDSPPTRRSPGQMPNRGFAAAIGSWAPGTSLDLGKEFGERPLFGQSGLQQTIREKYYEQFARIAAQFQTGFGLTQESLSVESSFEMLSIYAMLSPPDYLQNPPENTKVVRIFRRGFRELDLSDHFTEPCLIVMGWLDAAPLPFPMQLDGEPIDGEGRVFVRWVLPLPAESSWVVPDRTTPAK